MVAADEKERAGGAGRPFKASRIVEQGRPENLELERHAEYNSTHGRIPQQIQNAKFQRG